MLTVPVDLVWQGRAPLVVLGEIPAEVLAATPTWDEAIGRHARRTSLVPLDSIPLDDRALGLIGAIHHMTRCGSTALLRQFAALEGLAGVSEPMIFFKLCNRLEVDSALAAPRVRRLISLFRDGLAPVAERMVIKWPTLLCRWADLLAAALPEVPMVFIHRRPDEVLASIEARPLGNVHDLPPRLLAGPQDDPAQVAPTDGLAAIVAALAANCRWIAQVPSVRRLDFTELPQAGWRDVAPFFGITPTAEQLSAMQSEAARDAKNRNRAFVPDSMGKRVTASPDAQRLASEVLAPALAEVTSNLASVRDN